MQTKLPDAATNDDAAVDAVTACPVGVTTMCAGADLITCDGQGNITGTQTCNLGCSDLDLRCKKVSPSNNLSMLFDEAEGATDFVLSGSATIDTDSGAITDQSGARTPLTSTVTSGVPVGVLVLKVKSFATGGNVTVTGSRALAILSAGDVVINHDISLSARQELNGPGAITTDASCRGANAAAGNANGEPGGGGGAFGTVGGKGGTGGSPVVMGANGGMISGSPEIVPLRGGCPGGRGSGADAGFFAGAGGGAVQIVSGTSIAIGDGGALLANGSAGRGPVGPILCFVDSPCGNGEGGGAGGGILLEAPTVTVAATGGIFANGGGGSCGVYGAGQNGQRSTSVAMGQQCGNDTGNGGNGAAGATAAQNGGNGMNDDPVGGGGGGGSGRIRVNLPLGSTFTPAGDVSGVLSAGTLQTR